MPGRDGSGAGLGIQCQTRKNKNNITTTPCCESCNTPTTGQLWEYSTFTTYGAEFWHTCTVTVRPYSDAEHPGLKETQGRRTTFPLRTYAHPGDHKQHLIMECAFLPRHSITMLSTPNCKVPRGRRRRRRRGRRRF